MLFASSLIGMAAAWESVVINGIEVKMQLETGDDATVISSIIWEKLGRPTQDRTARTL